MKTVFQLKRRQNLFMKKYLLNSNYNGNSYVTIKQLCFDISKNLPVGPNWSKQL